MSNFKKPLHYAIDLLARRDYSRHKMRQKLKAKGYETDEIEQTIKHLEQLNYIREDEYARHRIKALALKGKSTEMILYQCKNEGTQATQKLVDDVFEKLDLTNEKQVRYLLLKKIRTGHQDNDANLNKEKLRLIRYAMSKGHSYQLAHNICEKILSSNQE